MFFLYFFVFLLFLIDLFLGIKLFEYLYCVIKKQPPFVPSADCLQDAVISQISDCYRNAKIICECGSGFGGLARNISKHTEAKVLALEIMPFSALVSKTLDFLHGSKSKTIWCDAYKYLEHIDNDIDVMITYLSPAYMTRLKKYRHKIKVIISLDFRISGIKPSKIITLGKGYTIYNIKKYPHRLYIYEFCKQD